MLLENDANIIIDLRVRVIPSVCLFAGKQSRLFPLAANMNLSWTLASCLLLSLHTCTTVVSLT